MSIAFVLCFFFLFIIYFSHTSVFIEDNANFKFVGGVALFITFRFSSDQVKFLREIFAKFR